MAFIALSVFGILAVVVVQSEWNLRIQLLFIFAVLVAGFLLYLGIDFLIMQRSGGIKKGSDFWIHIPWFEIGLYLAMIAGMAAKYFYDATGEGNRIEFKKWQFFKPIFISPIVFGSIYGNAGENAPILLLLIFAFQNGFFWQTVLNRK